MNKNEAPGLYDASGQVKFPPLVTSPEPLHSLDSRNETDSVVSAKYVNRFQLIWFKVRW